MPGQAAVCETSVRLKQSCLPTTVGGPPTVQVTLDRHLAGRIIARHEANLSKDWSFGAPSAIVSPEHPEDPAVRVGIATIQGVLVVQFDHDLQGISGRLRPFQNLLTPQHPQVVVDLSRSDELHLGGIPQFVVSCGRLEFFQDRTRALAGQTRVPRALPGPTPGRDSYWSKLVSLEHML